MARLHHRAKADGRHPLRPRGAICGGRRRLSEPADPTGCRAPAVGIVRGRSAAVAAVKARAQAILRRDHASEDAGNPAYQLSEYLGGDLPDGVQIWSKAGHNLWTGDANTSWFKHDMIRVASRGPQALDHGADHPRAGHGANPSASFPADRAADLGDDRGHHARLTSPSQASPRTIGGPDAIENGQRPPDHVGRTG